MSEQSMPVTEKDRAIKQTGQLLYSTKEQDRAKPSRSVRTLFISDVHLGTRACQAELLADFLLSHDAQAIFLVGDIMEGHCLTRRKRWSLRHNRVIQILFEKVRQGTRVIYIPGNHDHLMRRCIGQSFQGIEIRQNALYEGADGRVYFVTHGDQFDVVQKRMRWLASVGHGGYHALLSINGGVNRIRQMLGWEYWSLSQWAKQKVKQVVTRVSHFEQSLCEEAKYNGADGVVCGHIHHAADHMISGIRYLNAGDWVETCSGIIESNDGQINVVTWPSRHFSKPSVTELHPSHQVPAFHLGGEYAGMDVVRNFQLRIRSAVDSHNH
ncbi:MAG: UDP-2,3-diacylglucosamine hydrolase [Candidatus Celerinatantimonas neptuna]|nr:MAG: UDP-2,3-diacylglucosamine hydrolase [Candidatus Celerinatantimonas neptuna]